jgi:hypothetical protein
VSAPPRQRITQKDLAEGVDLDFSEEREYWNTYTLVSGETLKVKLVLRGVKRLKKSGPDGNPIYLIQSANVIRVLNIPDEFKSKPKPSTFTPV